MWYVDPWKKSSVFALSVKNCKPFTLCPILLWHASHFKWLWKFCWFAMKYEIRKKKKKNCFYLNENLSVKTTGNDTFWHHWMTYWVFLHSIVFQLTSLIWYTFYVFSGIPIGEHTYAVHQPQTIELPMTKVWHSAISQLQFRLFRFAFSHLHLTKCGHILPAKHRNCFAWSSVYTNYFYDTSVIFSNFINTI